MIRKFSIIIPVYNAALYLRECLNSVLRAAAETILVEIICVDDGSTDGSGEMLDEFVGEMRVPNSNSSFQLKVLHQKNAGAAAARNAGLDVATGDYICFIDADDIIAPGWLTNFKNAIEKTDCDLVSAGHCSFSNESPQLDARPVGAIVEHYAEADIRQRLVRRFLDGGYSWLYAFRREMSEGIRFVEGIRLAEDMLFFLRMSPRIRSFVNTDYAGYGYRQHAQSLTAVKLRSRERLDFLKAFAELRAETEGVCTSVEVWHEVQYWLVNAADVEVSMAIRDELRHLQGLGMFRIGDLPQLSRPGAALFMQCPCWPRLVRFVHCAVYKVGRWLGWECVVS